MASAAASESILFIGAILAAAALATALGAVAQELSGDLRARADHLGAEMTGRIAIINDPVNVPTAPLELYVKNTGSREQALAGFVVLLDGAAATWTATVGGAPADVLKPGELATFAVASPALAAGDHRVQVVSDTNAVATFEFQV